MIRRIDHVSVAVRDLDKAREFFIDTLGGRELFSMAMPDQGFRWTTFELGTSCLIEVIDPLEGDGFLQRFLEKRGEGPHHVTIQVDDIARVMAVLEEKGIEMFGYSEALSGWKEVFVHPKQAFGTLIQFAEFNPLDWVNEGLRPLAYREFFPPVKEDLGEITVHTKYSKDASYVEIKQGDRTVSVSRDRLNDLISLLQSI